MKLSIVGAGNIGAQLALGAVQKKLGEIVLIDIVEGMPQGKVLDMLQSMPLQGIDAKLKGTNNYMDTKDSDIVVVTAGLPRKPGMTRKDLIETNSKIIKWIIPEIVKHSPNSIIIIVTNPLDNMVQLAYGVSGFPKNRVIGMSGMLDTSRFKHFIAEKTKTSVKDIEASVIGPHNDKMVPVVSNCRVGGKPLTELLSEDEIKEIVERTKKGGAEIVALLKTGSAFFAPAFSILEMIECIALDQKKTIPCSVLLEGEYGVEGKYLCVPVVLGREGVEKIIEMELDNLEGDAFMQASKSS